MFEALACLAEFSLKQMTQSAGPCKSDRVREHPNVHGLGILCAHTERMGRSEPI